jgi:hypothetical protein
MKPIYHQHYSEEDCEYYPRPKGRIFKVISFLAFCALFLAFFSVPIIIGSVVGYRAGVDYALSLSTAPIKINHVEPPVQPRVPEVITGVASHYDYSLNGIEWSKTHRTAASRRFARYSYVKVTNPDNGKSVVVFINDYGPEAWTGREIDLSSYAFSQLAPLSLGLINVQVEPYKL